MKSFLEMFGDVELLKTNAKGNIMGQKSIIYSRKIEGKKYKRREFDMT